MKKNIFFFLILIGIWLISTRNLNAGKTPSFNHIALYVTDLKRSTAFSRDVIQLKIIPEPFHDGKHTWFNIGPHSQLHIIQGAALVKDHDKNTHLCFAVNSLEDFMKHLDKEKVDYENWPGTSKVPTPRPDGVKQVYFKDPDGYWIEINNDKY